MAMQIIDRLSDKVGILALQSVLRASHFVTSLARKSSKKPELRLVRSQKHPTTLGKERSEKPVKKEAIATKHQVKRACQKQISKKFS